jgi:virginiamycin B lyase
MTMRRARVRRAMAMAVGTLVLPALAIMGVGVPGAAADDDHHRPARAGGFQVFPVPTPSAGLGRIATAPNGDMWFVEKATNKLGRITPSGAFTEVGMDPVLGALNDLDVDASGNIWLAFARGVARMHPSDLTTGVSYETPARFVREVRVGPTATWGAGSTANPGVVRIAGGGWTAEPAPACAEALGRGRDGLMWCADFDRLIQVNEGGTSGVTYPLPAGATYPYSIAAGPNGKIWFGRDDGGSWYTSPANGNIGWVGDNGQVGTIRTGDRTAPRSLVTGADGNVWFTSVGAAKGIGHVNAAGVGAVVQVGNYEPAALTYGADGAIWFTDKANNSIVRVPREGLWVTNVNVGANSQLIPHAQPPVTVKKKLKADEKRKKAKVTVSCGNGLVACSGTVVVKAGKRKVAAGSYAVAVSSSGKVSVKLTKAGRALLRRGRSVKVKVVLTAATGAQTTTKATLTR